MPLPTASSRTPLLAVRALEEPRVGFHPRHIAERCGLFTIIVLGESVLGVASGTAGTDWAPAAMLTAVFGFIVAACLWWIYFDYVDTTGMDLAPKPALYWGYGHLAVYAAIAAFGVGVQLAIESAAPGATAAAPTGAGFGPAGRAILCGSVPVYLVAASFVQYVNRHFLNERVALVRFAVWACLLALIPLGSPLPPPAFVAAVSRILVALTVFETIHQARRSAPVTDAAEDQSA